MFEVALVAVATLLLLGFWRLQIVHASHYLELAENNRRRDVVIGAPRGLVTDRHGELLAANRAAFNVAIVREVLGDAEATLHWLSEVLGQPPGELETRLARHRGTPSFRPVVIAEDVPQRTVAAIEVRKREYPGVLIQPEPKRFYPNDSLAAHVLGHVGEISRDQLDSWGERFRMGDIVGQNGIERVHNEELAGYAGERHMIANSAGRAIRVLNERPPEPGKTLTLTLDINLQRAVENQLAGKQGAIVVLDVHTGGVLAMASSPTFDPNIFASRFSASEWAAIVDDLAKPLHNRALQSEHPPGSIMKLMVAVAGLERGTITPETTVFCPGGGNFFGRYYACWLGGGHGRVNLRRAIGNSCNVYFYELGQKLGRDAIIEVAQRFGLGSITGIDLLDERRGILPTDEWLASNRSGRWFPGETITLSIGQGPITVTPLQLAHMAAVLATGVDVRPHLVERVEDAAMRSRPVSAAPHPGIRATVTELDPGDRGQVLEGMWAVVNDNGSGWRARHPRIPIGGKTGTAQVVSEAVAGPEEDRPERFRNHAWFVGLAPIDDPEIAVAVLIEHGGGGGQAAAPVAGRVFTAYFDGGDATVPADVAGSDGDEPQ